MEEEVDNTLHLKGQMNFNPDWGVIMFLGSPAIKDLEGLRKCGLFICDLAMHDFSRDLLLAGEQSIPLGGSYGIHIVISFKKNVSQTDMSL